MICFVKNHRCVNVLQDGLPENSDMDEIRILIPCL